MVHISIIVIILTTIIFFGFIIIQRDHPDIKINRRSVSPGVKTIKINLPKFINDFTVEYSVFDKNGNTTGTFPLPLGTVSTIELNNYIIINIKQISTGKIVSTYHYPDVISQGVNLTLDNNNTLNLPSTIVTVVNNIPTQITVD